MDEFLIKFFMLMTTLAILATGIALNDIYKKLDKLEGKE